MRLSDVTGSGATAEQRAVIAATLAGKRGAVTPPVAAWLHSPGLAGPAQQLGAFVRYDTCLPAPLTEMAILMVARHWDARFEWFAHARLARQAGLPEAVVQDILHRRTPDFEDDAARAIFEYAATLLRMRRVPAPMHDAMVAAWGERGVVELVGLLGYYGLVSMTLNAFEVGLPEGAACELDDVP